MNEQEIIEYLKGNKTKGTVFAFMPSEVKDWCIKHRNEQIFYIFDDDRWPNYKTTINCYSYNVYCLTEDYEAKPAFKADWEIFDIDEHGWFTTNADSDHSPTPYYWWQWQMFLSANDDKYNAFGGWYFDSVKLWNTNPQVLTSLGAIDGITDCTKDIGEDRPAIPTKIAFWRYRE